MKQAEVLVCSITLCLITGAAVTAKLKSRITIDQFARPGEFPYQVSLQYNGAHHCGGSLITQQHVLTAAHCVHDWVVRREPMELIKVAVGTTTVPGGIIHDVERIAHHSLYNKKTVYADVAVIRLTTWVVESRTVRRIALPPRNLVLQPYHKFITSGFGASTLRGRSSPSLKKLVMSAVRRPSCVRTWGQVVGNNDGLFCAQNRGGAGVCSGDSGGPLTIDKKIVIGIASAVDKGAGCGRGTPDLFTKVTTYLDFIESEIALY